MTYDVVWTPAAVSQLLRLSALLADPSGVAEGIDRIENALRTDPHNEGESRGNGTRVAFFGPLTVRFFVDESIRTAVVTSVARPRR